MGWIFQYDKRRRVGNGPVSGTENGCDTSERKERRLLTRGSFVIEFELSSSSKVPQKLVAYERTDQWIRRFNIYLNADYSLSVECQQGCADSYVVLPGDQENMVGPMCLTFAWDAPERTGLLALENTETGLIKQIRFQAPIPMPLEDVNALTSRFQNSENESIIQSFVVSNRFEDVGPRATIGAGALVETTSGPRSIERLELGEMVITQGHGPQPIRWILKQELPASGRSSPMRICAPYFGLSDDITVSHEQRIMLSNTETEYNFGEDAVLLSIRNLQDHVATVTPANTVTFTCYQLLFDHHECISVSGAWLDSLYVGRMADDVDVVATSSLANVPLSALPLHRSRACLVLRQYETRALLDTMTA